MKIRDGFVSNSSSASFTVSKSGLTQLQIDIVKNICDILHYGSNERDFWNIDEGVGVIYFSTSMDNDDLESKLNQLGIKTYDSEDGF